MQCEKTKLGITSTFPVSISSTVHGANLDAVGFNVDFIAKRDPKMVADLFKLYKRAKKLTEKPPLHRFDERFDKALPLVKEEMLNE